MNTNSEKDRLEDFKYSILSAQGLYLGSKKKIEAKDLGSLLPQNNPDLEQKEDLDDAIKQRFMSGNFQPSSTINIDSSVEEFEEKLRSSRK